LVQETSNDTEPEFNSDDDNSMNDEVEQESYVYDNTEELKKERKVARFKGL